MKLPIVKPELLASIGNQLSDTAYLNRLEQEFWQENPALAHIVDKAAEVMNKTISNDQDLQIANYSARTLCMLIYNGLKQQLICDELEE